MIIFPQKQLEQYDVWAFFENVLTPEECEGLRKSFDFNIATGATVGKGEKNDSIRKCLVNWIKTGKQYEWLFDRIAKAAIGCNETRWKFQLTGFLEGIQFAHYKGTDFYNWHQDNGNAEFSKRKLSVVVQLSDPEDYKGGDLEFIVGGKAVKSLGSIIVFPSYQVHRVTPVIEGSRYSMAAWISGDSYR